MGTARRINEQDMCRQACRFHVYRRAGLPCYHCDTDIIKGSFCGRMGYLCPNGTRLSLFEPIVGSNSFDRPRCKLAPDAPVSGVIGNTLKNLCQYDATQGKVFIFKYELLQCGHMWQITTREEIDPDTGIDQNH